MPLLLSPASSTTPSPALLDFLAQLSPPPSPNSPPTPAFLCPACTKPEISSARRRRRERSTSASTNPAITPADQRPKQHSESSYHSSTRSKTSNNQYDSIDFSVIAAVPPKYEQSSDGFWYIATSWSLHGKTSQPNLFSSPTPTPSSTSSFPPSNVVVATQLPDRDDDDDDDDDADDLSTTVSYNDTVVSTIASDYDAIKDSLPTGWTLTPERTKFYNYEVIIVVSLILAILLSLIIAGCVLGHKARSGSRGQSFKKILNEAKARANAQKNLSRTSSRSEVEVDTEGGDPDLEILSDSERAEKILKIIRRKEKLWDKWRNKNGKLSDLGLRRRKKKTITVTSTAGTPAVQAVVTVNEIVPPIPTIIVPDDLSSVELVTAAPPSSLRHVNTASMSTLSGWSGPATSSQPSPRLGNSLPNPSSSLEPSTSTTSSSLPLPFLPTTHRHPPAYYRGAAVNDQQASPSITQVDRTATKFDDHQDDYHVIPNGPYLLDQDQETQHALEEYPHPEYSPPSSLSTVNLPHRAHVATDDKAVLEKMRQGVSEPQDAATSTSIPPSLALESLNIVSQSEPVHPNAPPWVDESIEDLEDVSDRDPDVKTLNIPPLISHNQSTQLPPLPSADFHRHLERHYNAEVLFPLEEPSMSQPLSLSAPLILESTLPSSPNLQPSAPPIEDVEEGPSNLLIPLRPSAPLLADEDEDELFGTLDDDDNEEETGSDVEDDRNERQSRWDREVDLEASLGRTRSTPSIAAATISNSSHYSRSRRRRSLSVSSTINGSSNPSKRISLPRYEP